MTDRRSTRALSDGWYRASKRADTAILALHAIRRECRAALANGPFVHGPSQWADIVRQIEWECDAVLRELGAVKTGDEE